MLHRIAFPVVSEWYQDHLSFGLYRRRPERSKIRTSVVLVATTPRRYASVKETLRHHDTRYQGQVGRHHWSKQATLRDPRGPAYPRAAVVDLVRVRLAWQPGPGRHRRRARRHGRGDGGAVRRGPHDPGSLG